MEISEQAKKDSINFKVQGSHPIVQLFDLRAHITTEAWEALMKSSGRDEEKLIDTLSKVIEDSLNTGVPEGCPKVFKVTHKGEEI